MVGDGEVGGEAANFARFPFLRCLFPLLRGGEATDFGDFPLLRCLLGFLPALKAANFAWFPFLRCLLALLRGGKATDFGVFPHLRCLLGFLPAGKATDFAGFPFLRCLSAIPRKNEIFRQTHCNPASGMIQYRVSSYVSRHACLPAEHRLRHLCKALEWRFNCE